jgi:hypothetical protein
MPVIQVNSGPSHAGFIRSGADMNQEIWEQLRELRNAITEAVSRSERVSNAAAALMRSGRDVQIQIDAALVDGETHTDDSTGVIQGERDSAGALMLDPGDRLFLQALRISDV